MTVEEAIQTNSFESPAHKAAINIMYVAYRVKTFVSGQLKGFGLTPEQYNVLRILNGKHPAAMCVKDIGSRMIERSSNVPRIIDRLEQKQWVVRQQSGADRRETIVQLTPAALQLLQTIKPTMDDAHRQMSQMSPQDLVLLNSLLDNYLM
ncbi:MAG: MarR family transcriptional regulator [Bacteroidetes bacterium]|nr:MAG: MarR family transcriptional regulator [Bacteroidota bacterium]